MEPSIVLCGFDFTSGVWVVSGIFSIPLEACQLRATEARRDGAARRSLLREYIGCEENQLVRHAAESLLRGETSYSPYVFHGPTGTGKTLLALGLAARWRQENPHDCVIVTGGSDFARSYANAVDTDSLSAFRKKCRSARLFVLDDVHLMQHKRAAQDELTRFMDFLLECGVVTLFTANTAPTADIRLQPRLRSRLSGGLPVALTVPGAAARMVLLRRLADVHEVHLSEAAIELLAGGSPEAPAEPLTVPQLNHAVLQLVHGVDERTQLIDVERVRRFLLEQASQRQPTFRLIAAKVGKYFSLTNQELRGSSRRQHVVRARGVAMLLSWNLTKKSLESVGHYFGNRDHTTVLHACRKTELLQQTDPAIGKAMEELLSQLNALS